MPMRVVFVVLVLSLLAHAQPCHDIRTFDFANATIRTSSSDQNELKGTFNAAWGAETFHFKRGTSESFLDDSQRQAGTPEGRTVIASDSVIALPSGPVVRFLVITWMHLQGTGAHSFVLGFVCRNQALHQVFQFSSEYGPDFEIAPDNQLVIKQQIWAEHDPHCCPTETRTLHYAWNAAQQRFRRVRVDGPIPIEPRP